MKGATFNISEKILGPVHQPSKTDEWDYHRSPIIVKQFASCFEIGEVPSRPGK